MKKRLTLLSILLCVAILLSSCGALNIFHPISVMKQKVRAGNYRISINVETKSSTYRSGIMENYGTPFYTGYTGDYIGVASNGKIMFPPELLEVLLDASNYTELKGAENTWVQRPDVVINGVEDVRFTIYEDSYDSDVMFTIYEDSYDSGERHCSIRMKTELNGIDAEIVVKIFDFGKVKG